MPCPLLSVIREADLQRLKQAGFALPAIAISNVEAYVHTPRWHADMMHYVYAEGNVYILRWH